MKVLVIVLINILIAIVPFAFIWSINQLFGMTIQYSLWNLVAAGLLIGLVRG